MKYRILISLLPIIGLVGCSLFKTKHKACSIHEVKYLSTYIDFQMWDVAGGDTLIDLAWAKKLSGLKNEKIKTANFFIPMIIKEIERYYSDGYLDANEKNIIREFTSITAKIWDDNTVRVNLGGAEMEYCDKTNLIITEYHKRSQDDTEFYKMIYTLDDGPFDGIDTDIELEIREEIEIGKMKLILRGNESYNTFEVVDELGQLLWRKIISRPEDYVIKDVSFASDPIRVENELGYKIALNGDGESLMLHLRKDGAFRLFFHSW